MHSLYLRRCNLPVLHPIACSSCLGYCSYSTSNRASAATTIAASLGVVIAAFLYFGVEKKAQLGRNVVAWSSFNAQNDWIPSTIQRVTFLDAPCTTNRCCASSTFVSHTTSRFVLGMRMIGCVKNSQNFII